MTKSTTAGYKNTFAYDKLIFMLSMMVIKPKEFFIMGGTWAVPVMEGLLENNFVKELKNDPTYDMSSFDREYGSVWSGSGEGSLFDGEAIDRCRTLKFPEYKACEKSKHGKYYYIFSIDVGRFRDKTEICVWKVFPQGMAQSIKHLVNIFTVPQKNSVKQCILIHQLYELFLPKRVIIDGNGVGVALTDQLVLPMEDPETGTHYSGWGVMNDDDNKYGKDYTKDTIYDVLYIVKANPDINDVAHTNAKQQILNCKIRLLINQRDAKIQLEGTKKWQKMSTYEKEKMLLPYTLTTGLKDEMLNLYDFNVVTESTSDKHILIKRTSTKLGKDRFSAFEYGLYYLKIYEDDIMSGRMANLERFFRIS